MKFMKWLVPLAVVAVLLTLALPVSAQGPGPVVRAVTYYGPMWVVVAGTNEDPFGGLPKNYALGPAQGFGIAGKFGYNPAGIVPGGVPSARSGDGSSPRKAINIEPA